MSTTEIRATLREMMEQYNASKTRWIERFGAVDGFDQWFTDQALPAQAAAIVNAAR